MARLSYSGDVKQPDKESAQSLLGTLIDYDAADNGVSIDSISLRLRDSGVYVVVSLSAEGSIPELESLADTIAQGAVNIGMEPDNTTALNSIEISGGVE